MMRKVSSCVPLANNYLYRSTIVSSTCAYRLQLSYYSAETKTDKKQQKPAKQQQAQQTTTVTKTTTPPPTKTSTPKKPVNPNLPFPHLSFSYENIHPVYEFSKTKEDRVLNLEDLVGHVSKKAYKNDKDTIKVEASGNLKEKKFSLYGIFDGHQGSFAAEYVKERLPYELVASPEFAAGNYEAAIKNAYAAVHKALLANKEYKPESPRYDFTSGTTASIALVTPTTTFFAQLGNTPILVKKTNQKEPKVLFIQRNPEDVERVRTSDILLMVNYAPVSDAKDRKGFWLETTKAGEEPQHGVSSLKTLGSLGDSLYEVPTYNAFCAAMRAFQTKLEQNKPKKVSRSRANDFSRTFKTLSEFVRSPEWKALENHVSIGKSREETSWILNGFAEGLFQIPGEIKHSSLTRSPQVTSVANSELQYAHLVSDGILIPKFDHDLRALREIDRIAARDEGKSREVMGAQYSNWFFGNFNDDISSVTIQYKK